MTIRIEQLTIEADEHNYLGLPTGCTDVTNDATYALDILSVVRHIMRERECMIIPIVRAAIVGPTNEYGHNMQVEVTYSKNGWRAIYGAHVGERVTNVQCYMD